MEEVKKEKYGTRKSILKTLFMENSISYLSNIWVVTCRYSINPDKNTRYLICIEGEVENKSIEHLLKHIKTNIPAIRVCFDESAKKIAVFNLKTQKDGVLSYELFKDTLIKRTCCKFVPSYALGSTESTPLSRYFRENMGKGFALTDIDFFITSKGLFVEEKNFIREDEGYLGVGQCISMKEIINDIFQNVGLNIICVDNNDFYIADINRINCNNTKFIKGWGNMAVFKLEKISKGELLNIVKG